MYEKLIRQRYQDQLRKAYELMKVLEENGVFDVRSSLTSSKRDKAGTLHMLSQKVLQSLMTLFFTNL